jgi:hypothetical protein
MSKVPTHGEFCVPAAHGRQYRFDGTLLASSTSRRAGSHRWVEFSLYRSDGGALILARAGHSLYYHAIGCEVVERNRLEPAHLAPGAVPCELCMPSPYDHVLCPERPRYWAQVYDDPQEMLAALQRDNGKMKYVTNVSVRLIEEAAVHDRSIAELWTTMMID